MKTGRTLARFAFLFTALATGFVANAGTIRDCEGPNHYILSKCEVDLRLEWTAVPDSLLAHGPGHAATLLEDGRVLVVGGRRPYRYDEATRTWITTPIGAEVYDPVTRTWSLTAPMNVPRGYGVLLVRLLDGRVLALEGEIDRQPLVPENNAEIFDPASGTWTRTASLIIPRSSCTATLLSNGEVLVAGGVAWGAIDMVAVAEIYNPASGAWRATAPLREPRWGHAATALPDGKILVVGGNSDSFFDEAALTAEVFDPATETWYPAGHVTQGSWHTATPMDDGWVLVAGGTKHECLGKCSETNVESTRLYDPRLGDWLDAGTLISPRHGHLAVPIPGQGVLLVGGRVGVTPVPYYTAEPVERLEFFNSRTWTWTEVAAINGLPASASAYYSATPLADGSVLLVGDVQGKRAVRLAY